MPTITMELFEYHNITKAREQAEAEIIRLKAERNAALNDDPAGRIRHLREVLEQAKTVIRFAVGNLPPESVRHWPYSNLGAFADGLAEIARAEGNQFDIELAQTFKQWITDAQDVERERRELDRGRALAAAASPPAPPAPSAPPPVVNE